MKKLLLIGGSGFIGRNLIEYLGIYHKDKYDIIAPSSSELDCTDVDSVQKWFEGQYYDIVCHFGWYKNFGHPFRDETKEVEYNLRSYFLLEKHHKSFGKMFYLGSGAEYDKKHDIIDASEEQIGKYVPEDAYGLVKYIIGKQIDSSENIYNLRVFGLFGKYEDYSYKFISGLCAKAVKGYPLSVRQNLYFDFLYISDFCELLVGFMEKRELHFHTYNMASESKVSLLEICKLVKKISGKNLQILIGKDGLGREYTASGARLKYEFPQFRYTVFEQAVGELYEWFVQNESVIEKEKLQNS